jgi:acetyl-CoA carboxylase carboxyl transferase subunit alpha
MKNYLEFEKEIKILETDLEDLKNPFGSEGISEVDTQKIINTEEEINKKLKMTYASLNSWQRTLVARHEDRPRANFYIKKIFSSFTYLSGDRLFSDDKSVIAGFGLIDNKSVLIIGQEKGEDLTSRIERNFGMMRPEGYRKCIRLMQLANRFKIPIITFIDTPGAYPGVGAEQRGQASAIATSIECCMSLEVPNISIIIGEGGSGGAIALASSNKVIMLENSIYSVISPEGCASILWRDPSKSLQAAEAMKLTAKDLLELGIIDEVIKEPLGGAHRDRETMVQDTKYAIIKNLRYFENLSRDEIYNHRKTKFLKIGRERGFTKSASPNDSGLGYKESYSNKARREFNKNQYLYYCIIVFLLVLITVITVA